MADNISLTEELRRHAEPRTHADRVAGASTPVVDGVPALPAGEDEAAAGEPQVNQAAFGYYRGVRERALFIEFQLLEGPWPAPGYAWLPCPLWLPNGDGKGRGQAIVLDYVTGLRLVVRGRNLRKLFERILTQQVFRITHMGEEADQFLPEEATIVYAIVVTGTKEPDDGKKA